MSTDRSSSMNVTTFPHFPSNSVLKQAKAHYVVGLTATSVCRDGHHPIIFMQSGTVRHRAPIQLEIWSEYRTDPDLPASSTIQKVFRTLANDTERTRRASHDVLVPYREGRKILVLTERAEYLEFLCEALGEGIEHCFLALDGIVRVKKNIQ